MTSFSTASTHSYLEIETEAEATETFSPSKPGRLFVRCLDDPFDDFEVLDHKTYDFWLERLGIAEKLVNQPDHKESQSDY